jgi:hypothetical protein
VQAKFAKQHTHEVSVHLPPLPEDRLPSLVPQRYRNAHSRARWCSSPGVRPRDAIVNTKSGQVPSMGYISDPTVRWYHNKKHNNFYVPNEKREALACNQSHGQRGHSADPYLRVVAVFPTPSTFEFSGGACTPAVIIKTSCTI